MKILSFLLKSADSQVLFLLRPRGRYEAITEKIARIANPALHSSLVLPIIIVSFPKGNFPMFRRVLAVSQRGSA